MANDGQHLFLSRMQCLALRPLLGAAGAATGGGTMIDNLYHYRAELVRVIDGDTIDVDIDLGFDRMRTRKRLRLLGVDAPERGQAGYLEAKLFTEALLASATLIVVNTVSKDSFGRWLANVWCDGVSLNAQMAGNTLPQGTCLRDNND